jgi:septation ring formation regulator EzrA
MTKLDIADLGLLEEKINKAANLIERLRGEKNSAEEANKELKAKIEALYIKNEELERQIKDLRKTQTVSKHTDKSREEIKNKIEEMLAKLEGLEL